MNTAPCSVESECLNGVSELTESRARCPMCRWALDNGGIENLWRPETKGRKHPAAIKAKLDEKIARAKAKLAQRKNADPKKRYYSARAAGAEEKTNRKLQQSGMSARATRNSGRADQDGDHLVQFTSTAPRERLTLDTKLQSDAEHPRVSLAELDKVRGDAGRAGSCAGALLIRNKFGRGVVVFAEEDFNQLFA